MAVARSPTRIILESGNDADLSQADLDALARRLRSALRESNATEVEVYPIAHDAAGVGNQWADVLHVFIPAKDAVPDLVWSVTFDLAKDFMAARFRRRHEGQRPRIIAVRNVQTGDVEVVLRRNATDHDFVEIEIGADAHRTPPPLPLREREE